MWGDMKLVVGVLIELFEFGKLFGKYFIELV